LKILVQWFEGIIVGGIGVASYIAAEAMPIIGAEEDSEKIEINMNSDREQNDRL
jgi:hypothetical protein